MRGLINSTFPLTGLSPVVIIASKCRETSEISSGKRWEFLQKHEILSIQPFHASFFAEFARRYLLILIENIVEMLICAVSDMECYFRNIQI